MMTLMKQCWPLNVKLCVILCDCMYHLAKLDRPTKEIIKKQEGTKLLFAILERAQYHTLIGKIHDIYINQKYPLGGAF